MSNNNFVNSDRKEFRGRLDYFLHPSGNVTLPDQLKGRDEPLRQLRDCFETSGSQAFIWGTRGVGKTSIGHTVCKKYEDIVTLAAPITCEENTSFSELMTAILRKAAQENIIKLSEGSIQSSFSAFGFTISGGNLKSRENLIIGDINTASAFLNTLFNFDRFPETIPVIIIDEFDQLQNQETIKKLSGLLKQLSVDAVRVQFIFCGIAKDLRDLIGSHESVERYAYGVELPPLSYEAVDELIRDIEHEFKFELHRGQRLRIAQISTGYAGFTHLILKNILLAMYESGVENRTVPDDIYKKGVHRSAEQAATRLRTAYEEAIKQGTDRYIEVLWALANGQHMDRQFKDITNDYDRIIAQRPNCRGLDTSKNNATDLRNALNSLTKRGYLRKRKTGWYSYVDPLFRSYVRLIAEKEGVELGNESFPT